VRLLPLACLVFVAFVVASAPARADIIVLDFNIYPGNVDGSGNPSPVPLIPVIDYLAQYGLTIDNGGIVDSMRTLLFGDAEAASYERNGSGISIVQLSATDPYTLSSSAPFSLLSFEMAPRFWQRPLMVRFTGFLDGATTGSVDVTLNFGFQWTTVTETQTLGVVDAIRMTPVSAPEQQMSAFGASVAIDDDTVIVGEPGFSSSQTPGAAYVFARNHGGTDIWGEVQKLTPNDTGIQDGFGSGISISGDTVVIGAPGLRPPPARARHMCSHAPDQACGKNLRN
jgi:FG-GAP repeat